MWAYIAVIIVLAALLMFAPMMAEAAEVEYMVQYSHTSDLFRGCPFHCDDVTEPQQDYLSPLGMTITAGKRRAWEIDLSHGFKRINTRDWERGSQFAVRLYPGRFHQP